MQHNTSEQVHAVQTNRQSGTASTCIRVSAWQIAFFLVAPFLVSLAGAAEPDEDSAFPSVAVDPHQRAALDELSEIVVSGRKPVRTTQQLIVWLAKLGGKFTVEGNTYERGGDGPEDSKPLLGSANCIAFGLAPGIRCELKINWPSTSTPVGQPISGAVSMLNPGMILFGIEPRSSGIMHMLVDSKGVGEHAVGQLFNNTLVSKTSCLDSGGKCQRVVRITVEPDAQTILMQIDLEQEHKMALSLVFRRVPGSTADVLGGTPK